MFDAVMKHVGGEAFHFTLHPLHSHALFLIVVLPVHWLYFHI